MQDQFSNNRKFSPASYTQDIIQRRRLRLSALDFSSYRVFLLRAPIGYGKTILLSHWAKDAQEDGKSVGWVTLSEEDCAPSDFLQTLSKALNVDHASAGSIEELIGHISSHARPAMLFLDRYDEIVSSGSETIILKLIEASLPNLHIAIGGYSAGRLPVGSLIRNGDVQILGQERLSFTPSEQSLLIGPAPKGGAQLLQECSGWPLAIRLFKKFASHASASKIDFKAYCQNSGIYEVVHELLIEHHWQGGPHVAEIMGISKQVTSKQLHEICDDPNARRVADLMCERLPIARRAGNDAVIYTPIGIVNQLFKRRFAELNNDTRSHLALQAASCFRKSNQILEALNLAMLAGSPQSAVAFAESFGPLRLLLTYGVTPLLDLFEQLPADVLEHSPRIQLLIAVMYSKRGYLKESRQMVETCLKDAAPSDLSHPSSPLAIEIFFARMNLSAHFDADWIDKVEKESPSAFISDPILAGWLRTCSGIIEHQLGNLQKAELEFQKSNILFERLGTDYQLLYLNLHAAHILLARGLHKQAASAFSSVQKLSSSQYPSDKGLRAAAKIGFFEAKFHSKPHSLDMGALNAAVFDLLQSEGWFEPFASAYYIGTLCAWHKGGISLVENLLDEAEDEFIKQNIGHVQNYIRTLRALYLCKAGDIEKAQAILENLTFNSSNDASNPPARVFWRERHMRAVVDISMHNARGQYHQALEAAQHHQNDAEHDGRLCSLAEFLMWKAYLLEKLKKPEEFRQSFNAALSLACRLRLRSPLAQWLEFINRHINEINPDLPPKVREFVTSLENTLGAPHSAEFLLSEREIAVLKCVAQGFTNKRIAQEYSISPNTVKYHLKNIYSKLQIDGRREAAVFAQQLHITQ
ncbi:MAG: LuxR C-terminal-related transcriptional regulator [Pseudomonadota bacterium]